MLISGINGEALTVQYSNWLPDGTRRLNEVSNQLNHMCQTKWRHPILQGHECEEHWPDGGFIKDYTWVLNWDFWYIRERLPFAQGWWERDSEPLNRFFGGHGPVIDSHQKFWSVELPISEDFHTHIQLMLGTKIRLLELSRNCFNIPYQSFLCSTLRLFSKFSYLQHLGWYLERFLTDRKTEMIYFTYTEA